MRVVSAVRFGRRWAFASPIVVHPALLALGKSNFVGRAIQNFGARITAPDGGRQPDPLVLEANIAGCQLGIPDLWRTLPVHVSRLPNVVKLD